MLNIWQERMGPHMLKVHVPGLGVIHQFTAPDLGDPHDHPWEFRSTVLRGGYIEEAYRPDGSVETLVRLPGDRFEIAPNHVHRIVRLMDDVCWTCIEVLGPKVQEPGFYRWENGVMLSRRWFEDEFSPHVL